MNWLVDLVAVLAAPGAGVLGAWFGGRGVVQQARISAEKERDLERSRYDRERRDDAERELRKRAEALVLAVAAVRNLPADRSKDTGVDWAERLAKKEEVYPAYAALVVHAPVLVVEGRNLLEEAVEGQGLETTSMGFDTHFAEAVTRLNIAIADELTRGSEGAR